MLTFLTPNGWCRPTLSHLAEAMQLSEAKARARMQRLEQAHWRGQPLVRHLPHEEGAGAWTPAPALLDVQQAPPEMAAEEPQPKPAGHAAVVAWSRARYAHPRQEVEADIARRMGWGPPAFDGDDPAVAQGKQLAYGQLTGFGLSKEQALDVLARFGPIPHRAADQMAAAPSGQEPVPLSAGCFGRRLRAALVRAA